MSFHMGFALQSLTVSNQKIIDASKPKISAYKLGNVWLRKQRVKYAASIVENRTE